MPYHSPTKTLFIHIPKNAGKSFEIFLGIHNAYGGSPNGRSKPNEVAKYLLNVTSKPKAVEQLMGVVDKSFAAQHLTLQEIQLLRFLPTSVVRESQKVAIVRDPYTRAVSLFNHWRRARGHNDSEQGFLDFLAEIPELRDSKRHAVSSHFVEQSDYFRNVAGQFDEVDLLRFENLQSDVQRYARAHLPAEYHEKSLPHWKESPKEMKSRVFSDKAAALVEELYPNDFRLIEQSGLQQSN